MFDILVLGGGPAGVTAALRARELGAEVALIERGTLGGTCTNDGCVPTRVLARAARLVSEAGDFEHYGLVGVAPTVDFPRLLSGVEDTVRRMHAKKQMAARLEAGGVSVFTGTGNARFTDSHTLACADGTTHQGHQIIMAVGGHARRLPFQGHAYALTHSDIWALSHLPRSMAIVGGAATGCQLASIFAAFGSEVHLFEIGPRLLGAEDEAVSQGMMHAFERRGIALHVGISEIKRIEWLGSAVEVSYGGDDAVHTLTTDAVVLAVGWQANTESLNLAAVGIECEHGYIKVNDALQTTVPHIFAAGDVTGRMMLVQSACAEGALAAESAVLGPGGKARHRIVPHGGFTDPEYGSVGLTEHQARAQEGCVVAVVPYTQVDRALIDRHTEGFCKLIVSQATHRLLGAQVVGEQAVETIQLIAAAMSADMWVEQLAEVELAYPTFAALVSLAARHIVRELGVIPLAPAGRSQRQPEESGSAEWEWSAT